MLNDETVLLMSGVGLLYFVGRLGGPMFNSIADDYIHRMRSVLGQARADHTQAVKDRIDSVGEMKGVVDITKALFEVSKETARIEAQVFELDQKVKFAAEAKSVLDSWVRYELTQRQREQAEMADHVAQRVQRELSNPKFQQQILQQSIAEVERK